MIELKPTEEQFEEYIEIRDSGITNMFDVNRVCAFSLFGLTHEHCLYIMNHFRELAEEYDVDI